LYCLIISIIKYDKDDDNDDDRLYTSVNNPILQRLTKRDIILYLSLEVIEDEDITLHTLSTIIRANFGEILGEKGVEEDNEADDDNDNNNDDDNHDDDDVHNDGQNTTDVSTASAFGFTVIISLQ
jgi:hypothetical protein